MDHSRKSGISLMHYHQCVHCGHLHRREDCSTRAVSSGIYPCTRCGQDSPLNLVILEDAAAPLSSGPTGIR